MTMTTPQRSADQRLAALAHANVVRLSRADVKRRIRCADRKRAGQVVLALVASPPPWIETMLLRDLLLCLPGCGATKVDHILFARRVSWRKTITGLSDRQRTEVLNWLADYAERAA
jgi:hypothetical protein